MKIELTEKEFRRLLDMVYIGNWVLNSTRGSDRFTDYDHVQSKIFKHCFEAGMDLLADDDGIATYPSAAFCAGGIHEAIADYEDTTFFEILAEEFALRDMNYEPIGLDNMDELNMRIDEYIQEFEENGMDNITLEN